MTTERQKVIDKFYHMTNNHPGWLIEVIERFVSLKDLEGSLDFYHPKTPRDKEG